MQFAATTSIAASEPEELDRLDEVLRRLVGVGVLDRIGPGVEEHGQYLMRHIVYIEGQGLRVAGRPETPCCDRQKLFQYGCNTAALGRKDFGRSDAEVLDELAELDSKPYQQDTGISVCVSSGRFDTQFCEKRLSEMMSKPRRMCDLRRARLSR